MNAVNKNWLILGMTLALLVFISGSFSQMEPIGGATLFPVFFAIEIFVFFVASMVGNPRATIGMAFGSALLLTVTHIVCSLVGTILGFVAVTAEEAVNPFRSYINPIPFVLQLVLLVFAGPYMLASLLPDLIGKKEAAELLGGKAEPAKSTSEKKVDASPTGGFIQVFSYAELSGQLGKIPGIEGFILVSNEGLVVWREFPLRIDMDSLASRFLSHSDLVSGFVEKAGLTKVRRVMVESREHFLFSTTLDQNFSLILIFNSSVSSESIMSRIAVITKTCREFLQWKYPSLPIRSRSVRELDMVKND